jgi:hypothetical protein
MMILLYCTVLSSVYDVCESQLLIFCRRFLRARRFIVADAYKQFQETEDWRKANEIDKLYETIDLDQYEETRRLVR